ncbi:putative phage abortive infection protein [Bacillus thuringiensis]|uniref:putative phage abortive infection protein n=1 Tax=Bacillus thuringiensis TaxID=1428 RepID=UPI00159BC3A3|nr:putative phage abortive infection protein [Bacillus thuringiensis]
MKKWFSKTTNWMFFISMLCIVGAVGSPLLVYLHYSGKGDYTGIAALGPIGDFVGGTTVTFLTAASVFLLIGTNIMQRKELQMSRQSVDEMVKQTKASVKQMEASVRQAEEARKETQVTNETMKRQQFETTFFNMINLHHNILKEIQYKDYVGREVIYRLYKELGNTYNGTIYTEYKKKFSNNIIDSGDIDKLNDFVKQVIINRELSFFIRRFENDFIPIITADGGEDFRGLDLFYKSLDKGTNATWNSLKDMTMQEFEESVKNNLKKCGEIVEDFNFKGAIKDEDNIDHEYIAEFKMNYADDTLIEIKQDSYEKLYKRHEKIIGHYYRNLYRIVKLIQNTTFNNESQERDNEEKRKYRGILRAQLSSFELLMLFYNISYSEKGKKFKELIAGVNFFDDHLIEESFIWKNDIKEVASLNASKGVTETKSI